MRDHKILIVDDEYSIRRFSSRALIKRGFKVKSASSGREAETAIKEEKFSLIIIDIVMPDISGIELVRKIRNKEKKIPVIIMSGSLDYDIGNIMEELNIAGLLVKPFELKELIRTVEKHFCSYD